MQVPAHPPRKTGEGSNETGNTHPERGHVDKGVFLEIVALHCVQLPARTVLLKGAGYSKDFFVEEVVGYIQ